MGELHLRADLARIPDYRPGRRPPELGTEHPLGPMLKLSSNENPYPPLPSVQAAIATAAADVNRYPDAAAVGLVRALAKRTGVAPERVVLGSGSVEVLSQVIRATSGPGDEVVFAWRSFEAYPLLVAGAGAIPVQVPITVEAAHDLPAMLAAVTDATTCIIVCNPNNPTGTSVGAEELDRFLQAVPPHITVVLDEAYEQFNDRPDTARGLDALRKFPNVAVAHTFSKAYGLAGLRIGYAVAPLDLATAMRKVAIPFGVTDLALAAAGASLLAEEELDLRVRTLVAERERVVAALRDAGWWIPEAMGNFVWFPLGAGTSAAAEVLDRHRLLVRPFQDEGIRVTIGEAGENDRLLAAAAELAGAGLLPPVPVGASAR